MNAARKVDLFGDFSHEQATIPPKSEAKSIRSVELSVGGHSKHELKCTLIFHPVRAKNDPRRFPHPPQIGIAPYLGWVWVETNHVTSFFP